LFGDTADVLAKDFNKEKAKLDLGEAAKVTITVGGTLLGLSLRDSTVVRLRGDTRTQVKVPIGLEVTQPNVELSAVGEKVVVLDRTKQLLWFEGADQPMSLPAGSSARLAAPSPVTSHLDDRSPRSWRPPRASSGCGTASSARCRAWCLRARPASRSPWATASTP
jgi:hypothetical protein